MKNIIFLVFVLLLESITGDPSHATENIIPSGSCLGRNLSEVMSKNLTTITKENPNDNELRNESKPEKSEENKKITLEAPRKSRESALGTSNLGIECVSCHGSGLTTTDENCYKGAPAKTQKCAEVEQCFTELHPQYIKRGCTLPSSINRTFVCKCPLCNDKPSEDLTYYEYRTISDWEYDNKRLGESVVGLDLLCKVCSTKGINAVADNNCKLGKNADYMQCGHEELCFTNIDHQIDFISRGCISKPVYNSLYFFCNDSKCNNNIYPNPRKKRSEFYFTAIPMEAILLLFFVSILESKQDPKEASKSKNPLPYFRRQVEGLPESSTFEPLKDDLSSNLVSILVKNVKEIFDDINDGNEVKLTTFRLTTDDFKQTKLLMKEETALTSTMLTYENLSLTTLLDHNLISDKEDIEKTLRSELMHLTKALKSYEKSDPSHNKVDDVVLTSISSLVLDTTEHSDEDDSKRSCIFCDNIVFENCIDPQNKLIPSISCEREGDLCYSQHTPFGVIDRGCFNVNHNLTTYVCSCNLCNYISISEMPYIFSNKQDWVDDVVELSRTKSFRKSVFKDMACLRCEVNTTTQMGDMLNSANCLEGNIGHLPIQDCDENEICAVRAVRSDGYIWRGCVPAPLYNYWWALCDTDLCNYDPLVSIYDFVGTKIIKHDQPRRSG